MRELPSGTVTLVFTDVEGSTQLLHELGAERYGRALAKHRRLLRSAFAARRGVEIDTQGDAFFYAFARASDAVGAAQAGQRALDGVAVLVRIGVHTGEPRLTSEGYVGTDVHLAARVMGAGHGGQVLVSEATARLVEAELRDLGQHRLKDFERPVRLFQLGYGRFPPLRTLSNSNLPLMQTPLLGRKKELADVLRLFRVDQTPLVTVTGPGGVGKTRVALEVARELVEEFADGVWFVDLSALRDPELVMLTIAPTIGAKGQLAVHLADKKLLLVLDNFEHVVEAARDVADLLRRCPNLQLLVASREPLHVTGERSYPLEPLAELPAVELFRERAEAADPAYDASSETLTAIVDRVDRLPLAIELAAARAKVLAPEQLLMRLDQRLPLLTSRARDLPDRQRTLAATIEWSYDLLDEHEKRAFERIAVFAGGCTAEAAERVGEVDLDTLGSLVEKSLLRAEAGRFVLLETIREFAGQRLEESHDAEIVRRRHVEYFADEVQAADRALQERLVGPDVLFRKLESERGNLRAALAYLRAIGDRELELKLAGSMEVFWALGHLDEGRLALDRALDGASEVPPHVRTRALAAAAHVAQSRGDFRRQRELVQEALVLADNDVRMRAWAISALCGLAILEGDLDEATTLLDESEKLATRAGDTRRLDGIAALRAHIPLYRGEYDEAKVLFEDALARFEAHQNLGGIGITLASLGFIALEQGREDDAADLFSRSLRLHERIALTTVGDTLEGVGAILGRRSKPEAGARLLGAAQAWREATGTSQQPFERGLAERVRAELHARLRAEAFADNLREGEAMEIQDAIELALASLSSPKTSSSATQSA